ncbi:MAG: hypothetical protein Q4B50_06265, partial [Bacillota bacterium]|nr:hypothetical protein [Bacillota bacterium]
TGETSSEMSYVDASGLTLSDMGSMGGSFGGGGAPDRDDNNRNFGDRGATDNTTSPKLNAEAGTFTADMNIQGTSAFTAEDTLQNGEMPEGRVPSQISGDFGGSSPGRSADETESTISDDSANNNRSFPGDMQMSGNPGLNDMDEAGSSSSDWIWFAGSVLVLAEGLIIAKLYKH